MDENFFKASAGLYGAFRAGWLAKMHPSVMDGPEEEARCGEAFFNWFAERQLAMVHEHRLSGNCICRTEGCGHLASQHTGPNGACVVCEKECWS